jgi:predicted transcriptional regulator
MPSTARKPLGELEAAILGALWDSRVGLSVREVLAGLSRRSELAYTTVMTVLDRLHDKGLVAREKQGKAFCYRPRVSREAYLGEQAARVLMEAEVPVHRDALMAFLDSAQHADPDVLDKLSALIDARRKQRA